MPTFFVDLPGGPMVKNPFANAWDMGSTPGLEGPTCFRVTKPMHHNRRRHHKEKLQQKAASVPLN